ncbi:hypothetical protein C8Q80DRAFT_1181024 [Daedaleopsis nitida]|nr:hypothetical protein C8Q80DRAFT_1181024 [Daedaleopsis nitida]
MRLAVFPQSLLLVLLSLSARWQVEATFTVSPGSLQLAQCTQVNLSWTEEPPILLWIAPNREVNPGDPTLETLGPVNATFLRWTVNLPVGQNVSFTYNRVAEPYTFVVSPQEYTVVEGDSSECLPKSNSTPSSTASTQPGVPPTSSIQTIVEATSTGPSPLAPTEISTSASAGASPNSSAKAGAIAGAIAAGSVLALCLGLIFV